MNRLRTLVALALLVLTPGTNQGIDVGGIQGLTPNGYHYPKSYDWILVQTYRVWGDVIFTGRFLSWTPCPPCDRYEQSPGGLIDCAVDSVLRGICPTRSVRFCREKQPSYPSGVLKAGTRIIGYVSRTCDGRLEHCGDFAIIGEGDTLLADGNPLAGVSSAMWDTTPLRLQDSLRDALGKGDFPDVLGGTAALVLADLGEPMALTSRCKVYPCRYLRTLFGRAPTSPKYVKNEPNEGCGAQLGFQFLLPIPSQFSGDTLTLRYCLRMLRVKDGEWISPGIPLDSLSSRVRITPGGLQIVESRR